MIILGVMLSRLKAESLKQHRVFPVSIHPSIHSIPRSNSNQTDLAISLDKRHVLLRGLIQVYMTSEGLLVKKSKLYDFISPDVRDDNTTLFVAHMATRFVGDTKSLIYPSPHDAPVATPVVQKKKSLKFPPLPR
jgi:hypothetical protein